MILHFCVLAIACVMAILFDNSKKKSLRTIVLFLLTLGLSLFIGYRRLNMGIDTFTYYNMYRSNRFDFDLTEISFPLIISICNRLGLNYSLFFTILAFITLFGFIFFVFRKIEIDHSLYIFLFISSFSYLYMTSAVRFFMAMAFAIIAAFYYSQKNYKTTIVMFLIALSFHFTIIIVIPVLFIANIKSFKKYFTLLFFLALFFLLSNFIISQLKSLLPLKYAYVISKADNSFGISTLKLSVEFILFYICKNKITDYKEFYELNLRILGFSIVYDLFPLAYRSIWFFKFPVWFLWPILLLNLKKSESRKDRNNAVIIQISLVIVYCVYYYYMLKSVGGKQNLIPYQFVE